MTEGLPMDKIIEDGFTRLTETIKELDTKADELDAAIRSDLAGLLERMAAKATPLVGKIGNELLDKSKQDAKGDLYDSRHYEMKMILLGRSDEPAAYRPDDMMKKVSRQFCILREDGVIAELMYSDDGFIIDSYINPLTPEEAIDLYGPGVIFMLYRALLEYGNLEEELVQALEKTLSFIQQEKEA